MNKKIKIPLLLLILIAVAAFFFFKFKRDDEIKEVIKEIKPAIGSIESVISTTGSILPKNRLSIKPPVNGRVESILVVEGQKVKPGEVLAWLSSSERAALLDAAIGQGEEKLKYWQDVYKPIALLAPISGEVIVATTQPGQTVTTADSVIVLSDELIARAQVDETDIGKVKLGQNAVISLDAYPDTQIKASVEHIYYESKVVNNVTIYEVDLTLQQVPAVMRSGMNTTINFIVSSSKGSLLIPLEAVHREMEESYVLLKRNSEKGPVKQVVELGISDDKNVEVLSGIGKADIVIIKTEKFSLPKTNTGTNPFMPFRGRRR